MKNFEASVLNRQIYYQVIKKKLGTQKQDKNKL